LDKSQSINLKRDALKFQTGRGFEENRDEFETREVQTISFLKRIMFKKIRRGNLELR